MSPEEHGTLAAEARARKRIDEKLVEAGWKVQDRAKANLYAGQGVALREFIHGEGHGRSDCALYVDRQLVGVLEAKPDGTTLTGMERQTRKYIEEVPDAIPAPVTPPPFGYEATGTESRFTCSPDPEPRSRRMFGGYIHRPETCRSCGIFDSCRGCMAAKFFTGLPLDGPDPECVRGHGEAALAAVRKVGAATLPRPSPDHSHRRVMVTIGRRPPPQSCDENPLAGFVTQ